MRAEEPRSPAREVLPHGSDPRGEEPAGAAAARLPDGVAARLYDLIAEAILARIARAHILAHTEGACDRPDETAARTMTGEPDDA